MYQSQATSLVKHLTARFRDADAAFEIAQEAWMRLMRHEAPERLENAEAFLFQTANNLAIDRVRRAAVEQRYLDTQATVNLPEEAPSAEQQAQSAEDLQALLAALAALPPAPRQAFVLHRFRGLPYPDIARLLGVSNSMVEKHIIRALKQLRAAIAPSG